VNTEGTTTQPDRIWVVGVRETKQSDRGFWDWKKIDREPVDLKTLTDGVASFVAGMHGVIARAEAEAGAWKLDEVQVNVEVGAKGSVSLLGTGGEVSGGGGLTLTFRRG
jgi:hypothetical protein